MSPHMRGDDATILVLLLGAGMAFGVCGLLSIVALVFPNRAGRIAQRLAFTGLILVHLICLAGGSEFWGRVVDEPLNPLFVPIPIAHVLVLAGYLRLRAVKRRRSTAFT